MPIVGMVVTQKKSECPLLWKCAKNAFDERNEWDNFDTTMMESADACCDLFAEQDQHGAKPDDDADQHCCAQEVLNVDPERKCKGEGRLEELEGCVCGGTDVCKHRQFCHDMKEESEKCQSSALD